MQRIRSSLDLDELLQATIDELGAATDASRSLIELAPNAEGVALMVEWDRGDTRPLGLMPPTPIARRVFANGQAVVIGDRGAVDDPAIGEYLRSVDSVSAVSYPLIWRDRVIAVAGFQDSRPRAWEDHALPLLERAGEPLAAALALAEALEEQRQLARMRDELIANVSHELRTPLAAIVGSIMTLRRDGIPDGDRAAVLAVLDEQAHRLAALTDDLLDFSRFRRGAIRLQRVRVPLEALLDRALASVALPDGRSLRRRDGDGIEVEVDPHRMIQVFSNLLENAVRHGAGDVTVGSAASDGSVVVFVSDDGSGAEAGYEDEMFLPFSHRSDRSDSTGLGLPISRSIVEAHGGTLVYVPAGAAERHRFVVTLPRR